MNTRIEQMARKALKDDSFPEPVREVCENEAEMRDPIAIGNGLRRYLIKQFAEVRDGEYLADRYRWGGCAYPADYYKRAGHTHLSREWAKCSCDSHPNDLYFWGWTHVSLDFGYILQNGLQGYRDRIRAAKKKFAGQQDKVVLLEGMDLALTAIQERSTLIAGKAREKANACEAGEKQHWLDLAEIMEHTPMQPARNFYEAVQCVWTMFLSTADSLGRIDQYLYPFYRREIDAGTLTREHALELLEELFVKVHESQVDNRPQPHSGHNHLVVGGYLQNGEDGFNDLSVLILDAIAELPTFRPQASFRYTRKTKPETMRLITEYNRRCPLIVFVNDEPRIEGMVRAGIKREDAIEYTVLGCNEWAICGKSKLDLAHISLLHSLKTLLWDKRAEALQCTTFEQLYALYETCIRADMERIAAEYAVYDEQQMQDINVLTSALIDDCIENARTYTDRGTRYYGLTMSFNGIPNVTDSLSVIREYVYDRKLLTLEQMLMILDANWEGSEVLHGQIMKHGRFFGNGDDYADSIAQDIVSSIEQIRKDIGNEHIKNIVCGSFVGATQPNIILGKKMPATPDGRMAGEEMTMGVSQTNGRDRSGMTALLRSIASIDYSRFCGCVVSNIKIDPRMADTPDKITRISQLFHTFLMLGGMQLQINYISSKELYQAQAHPENYDNLMVRVTGYSGYFTLFDRDLQNDIIKRTENGHE